MLDACRERCLERLGDRPLREADGERGPACDRGRERHGLVAQRLVGHDARAQPMCERLVGGEEAPGEHHLHRKRLADRAGRELRAARAGDDPEADLGQAEARVLRGDHDVARLRELAASAEAEAVHGRDQRLLEPAHALPAVELPAREQVRRTFLGHRAHVGARRERAPGPTQHDAAHRVVRLERRQLVVEGAHHGVRERVQRLRAVQRDHGDREVGQDLAQDGFVGCHRGA